MSTTARGAQTVRAYAGPPVLTVVAESRYGAFEEVRERRGTAPWGALGEAFLPGGVAARTRQHDRLLTNDELWTVYKRCPEVRASIDEIVRVVSTWDWCVEPVLDPADPAYEDAMDVARNAQTFLESPNSDGETWQTLQSKLIRDLLIYDAEACEQVLGDDGLEELVAVRGGDVMPVVDVHQHVLGYRQVTAFGVATQAEFTTEEMSYLNLFPNTMRPGGTPIIETLIDEILTMFRGARSIMLAFDADETPPGILVIAGLADRAAKRAVASLKGMAGNDQKLRVLTTDNPTGLKTEWIEFRHTPKDLQYQQIIKEIVRRIWRLFGVKPVAMGDTEATPRATAEVQVDAQDSGLITPILELIQAQINMRTLPLLVGNPDDAAKIQFRFRTEKRLTASETEAMARALAVEFEHGVLTPNEWRREAGRAPYDESGDIPLIRQGASYGRLDALLGDVDDGLPAPDDEDVPGADEPAEDGGDGGDDAGVDPDATNPEGDDVAPGQVGRPTPPIRGLARAPRAMDRRAREVADLVAVRRGRQRVTARRAKLARFGWGSPDVRHATCGHHKCEPTYRSDGADEPGDIPDHWQPSEKFDGIRTLDLPKLARQIAGYKRAVSPLWNRARVSVLSRFSTALRDGRIDETEATRLLSGVHQDLDTLALKWSARTDPHYRAAAKIGRDAASDGARQAVVANWRARGEAYHDQAMRYLNETGGVISDLRSQLAVLAHASSRTPPAFVDTRAMGDDDLASRMLAAVSTVFSRNVSRISNWGGRLVELANEVMFDGYAEAQTLPIPDLEPGDGEGDQTTTAATVEWWCEWVAVFDENICPTCEAEGSAGFRPLDQVTRRPGGDTECRGNCRCLLAFWTKTEVDNGTAKSFRSRAPRGWRRSVTTREPVRVPLVAGSRSLA